MRLKFFEIDTETFFETKCVKTNTDTLKKMKKVSILRCLETSCHTLREGERKTFIRFAVALALVHIHNQNLFLTKKETHKKRKTWTWQ